METQDLTRRTMSGLHRRELLQAGLAAAGVMSTWPLATPTPLWGAEPGPPKHGGILRVRGWDPPHFDPHLTIAPFTHWTLSFVYSRLVRHKVGTGVQPGIFTVEPDVAESWETPDDTTYIFHLRKGVKWHNKPPLNGRELVAEGTDLRVQVLTLASRQCVPWHYHTEISDSFVSLEGPVVVETRAPRHVYRLAPGERCAVPPKTAHYVHGEADGPCKFLIVQGVGVYDFVAVGG